MRAVYHCKTCDFRLPYCVRTDRRFCQERCRIWWYGHPGRKRPDFSPGAWGLPEHPGKGQPKTLEAALQALAEARKHAAELDATARAMQLVDHQLRSKLAELRAEAITSRRELMKELEALQDELDEVRRERAKADDSGEAKQLREQVAALTAQIEKLEAEAAELRSAREQASKELSELRTAHADLAEQHAEEVRQLKAQAATTTALRDHLNRQHAEATRSRDEARGQHDSTRRELAAKETALARAGEQLAELRTALEQQAAQHAAEVRELKSQAAAATAREQELAQRHAELERNRDELHDQLEKTKHELTEKQAALGRVESEVLALRRDHAQAVERHASEASAAKSEAAAQAALYEEAKRSKDELQGRLDKSQAAEAETQRLLKGAASDLAEQWDRAEKAERVLAERTDELKQQRSNFAAVETAHRETHRVAESDSRSLRAEKARRIAAEQRVEELTRELGAVAHQHQAAADYDLAEMLQGRHDELLAAELREVRVHRDEAIAERELLSARILKLMAPGQYLEHAATAGYDLTRDPLIQLKREDVVVEDRLGHWQETREKTERARRFDPEQTLDEQACAAALAHRWQYVNHPHNWQKDRHPKWRIVGFLLDAETEQYLLKIARRRIDRMKKTTQGLIEGGA
jgi:chromosome segregation ATPase